MCHMRIDSHHHVWDLSVRPQGWIKGEAMQPILQDFALSDLRSVATDAGIDRSVIVQTVPDSAETPDLLDQAATDDFVAGVVGWVDMESSTAGEDLARHLEHAGAGKLVGIRELAQDKADPDWLMRPDVLAALRLVGEAGLTFDLLTLPPQLPAAIEAVRSNPDMRFVLDHLSKPRIAAGELQPWADDVCTLAELPNVACKVSGMVTEANWSDWTVSDLQPYVETVLETFGPDRLMFGTDWPVCLLAASYRQIVEAAEDLTAGLSDAEQEEFWSGTARRFYGLP
jgi:L-fucono-1,5-lactonase